jgi:hypothetical protein
VCVVSSDLGRDAEQKEQVADFTGHSDWCDLYTCASVAPQEDIRLHIVCMHLRSTTITLDCSMGTFFCMVLGPVAVKSTSAFQMRT